MYQRTPEQIALAEERKAKREKNQLVRSTRKNPGRIINRPWIRTTDLVQENEDQCRRPQRVRILTWNCLIRRELFPTSDCLKAHEREHMHHSELLATDPDVLCLQEVDRLEKLLPVLERAGYYCHYAAGPKKKHGCLIAFKANLYTINASKLVEYDNEEIRFEAEDRARVGRSFSTRNIASLVSLSSNTRRDRGMIIVTTHLFWHPRYTYERARQCGILVRATASFRSMLGCDDWPCIIAGGMFQVVSGEGAHDLVGIPTPDFNFSPDDAAYSLLVGDPLLPDQERLVMASRVVHISVDPTIPIMSTTTEQTEDGEAAVDSDRIITNARAATQADGLFTISELTDFFSVLPRLRSIYDEALGSSLASVSSPSQVSLFCDIVQLDSGRKGRHEPAYTSYTHYWKSVLDYLFILDPSNSRVTIGGVLSPHQTIDLAPGIPRKGVSGSDHVSLATELYW